MSIEETVTSLKALGVVSLAAVPFVFLKKEIRPLPGFHRAAWPTLSIILAGVIFFLGPPIVLSFLTILPLSDQIGMALASLLVLPFLFHVPRLFHDSAPAQFSVIRFAHSLGYAAWWWFLVTPLVLLLHSVVDFLVRWSGITVEPHLMEKMGVGNDLYSQFAFFLMAVVIAPLREEFLFRLLMVRWVSQSPARGWILLALAALASTNQNTVIPTLSLLAIVVFAKTPGLLKSVGFRHARSVEAVIVTAALFAFLHPWPTPIPLFVLGIALGKLHLHTGTFAAPFFLHSLFNAVAFTTLWIKA